MANSYKDLKKKDESEVSDRLTVKLGDIAKFKKLVKRKNSAGKDSDYEVINRINVSLC